MDQTTPAHQIVFRHHRERCRNTNMDRCFSLRAGCDHQEATSSGCQPLHNFTDFERDHFRENAFKPGIFREQLQNETDRTS